MKKKKKVSIEEIRDNLLGSSDIPPSELVQIILAKNKKRLIKILRDISLKENERKKNG